MTTKRRSMVTFRKNYGLGVTIPVPILASPGSGLIYSFSCRNQQVLLKIIGSKTALT